MKKKWVNALIAVIVLAVALACGAYSLLYDTQKIEGQEKITESVSPDGKYTVTAYLNSGETENAVLCDVTCNKFFGRDRNIYWNYPCDMAEIEWIDGNSVVINGVEIDVRIDTYDCRKDK